LFWASQTGRLDLAVEKNLQASDTTTNAPMPVNVERIERVESTVQTRTYTGTIRARRRSDLGFEVNGKITAVLVDEGDYVEQGQILATLDTDRLQAEKAATVASLEQAKSVLAELRAGPRTETINAARATAEAAKSQMEIAQLNLERRETLRQSGAISIEEYDLAEFAKRTSQANFEAAQQQLAELLAGTRLEKIDAQQAIVRQLEAAVRETDVMISKSVLTAPFAGTVTRRYLDPGSVAQASAPVIKLVELERLEAWIGLPVSLANGMQVGDKHSIVIENREYPATVIAKIGELDAATRTRTVLLQLDSETAKEVVSGQLCEMKMASTVPGTGFWIPTSSLSKGVRGLWSVMVVTATGDGYRTQKRDIEILNTDAARVLARGTIEEGDLIIVDGLHRIAEGQAVSPNDSR
jgi:multidrug resistance efflux pump